MPQSKNLGAYTDVRKVWDAALRSGGARWRLPTQQKATGQRHRLYIFRKIFHDTFGGDEYYHYEVVRDPDEPEVLIIRPREPVGEIETLEGGKPPEEELEDEDFLEEIAELKRELDLE